MGWGAQQRVPCHHRAAGAWRAAPPANTVRESSRSPSPSAAFASCGPMLPFVRENSHTRGNTRKFSVASVEPRGIPGLSPRTFPPLPVCMTQCSALPVCMTQCSALAVCMTQCSAFLFKPLRWGVHLGSTAHTRTRTKGPHAARALLRMATSRRGGYTKSPTLLVCLSINVFCGVCGVRGVAGRYQDGTGLQPGWRVPPWPNLTWFTLVCHTQCTG